MGNRITTDPQRRPNDPNDEIGQVIQMNDACVFHGVGGMSQAARLIPDNGEYSWAGTTGSCAVCSTCAPRRMERSGDCDDSGHCGWDGTIPQYKRTSYTAPVDECCIKQAKTIGNKTCDPKYKDGYLSGNCDNTFSNYCANKGSGALTDDKCKAWLNRAGSGGDSVLNNVCVGNALTDDICQNWCLRNPEKCSTNFASYCSDPDMFGDGSYCRVKSRDLGFEVDEAVRTFCVNNPEDEYCACYSALNDVESPAAKKDPTLKAILARPECYITKCSSGLAYQTKNMRNNLKTQGCPNVNICQNTVNALGNSSTELKNITQKCDQSQGSAPQKQSGSGIDMTSILKFFGDKNNFLIFLFVLVAMLFGYQLFFAKRKMPAVKITQT
jgi:hypothetical protein